MLRKTMIIVLGTFAMSAVAACGDDTLGTQTDASIDAIFPDVTGGEDTVDPGGDTTAPPPVRRFEFEMMYGDDGNPCRGTDRCVLSLSFTELRTAKVLYTENGAPVADRVVRFTIEDDATDLGRVNTLSSATQADGIAEVVVSGKEARVGQFVVKASIDGLDLAPLYFDVVISPKGLVPLTVVANYTGNRPVGAFDVRLYRQDQAGLPDCSDLMNLYQAQTATTARTNIPLAQSAKFPDFDGLESDGVQHYTILVFSINPQQAIQAWGCDDVAGEVSWESANTVLVEMVDRPPLYAGVYNITSRFDLVSALPEPYRTIVNYIVGIFQSPTGTLIQLVCDLAGGFENGASLSSFCGSLFNAQGDPTALGAFVFDLVDQIVTALLAETVVGTILDVGGDVADIIKAFEIEGRIHFNTEPDAEGRWHTWDNDETRGPDAFHYLDRVRVKWTLGANCDPDTEVGCGVRTFGLQGLGYGGPSIGGAFAASVADDWHLTIERHELNLNYGALLNHLIEKFLLPLIFNTQNPEASPIDSYEDLLGYILSGDTECLSVLGDCCDDFATRVSSQGSATHSAVHAACTVLVSGLANWVRQQLQGLTASTGEAFGMGTQSSCLLSDSNNDMIVDGIGSRTQPCVWDAGGSVTFDAIFWGARAE